MRRHRAPRWIDWVGIGKGLFATALLVAACAAVTWLAVHGEPSHI
ncbi:hypothetical protein AB8O64_27535 [Streptomyces sp. QH1-20]